MSSIATAHWEATLELLESFERLISKNKASNVNSKKEVDSGRRLVQHYFRTSRPELLALGFGEEELGTLDAGMQQLLSLTNRPSRRATVLGLCAQISSAAESLTASRERRIGEIALDQHKRGSPSTHTEKLIVETLERLVPSAALSYRQALQDLASGDRVSYRGTANELREAVREVLDRLAPDVAVKALPGFTLEKGSNRPTQKQKVRYIMRSRGVSGTVARSPETTVDLVENLTGALARSVYERSSLSAHVSTARSEVLQLKLYVDSILAELLAIHRGLPQYEETLRA